MLTFDILLNVALLIAALLVPLILWRARRRGAQRSARIADLTARLAMSVGRAEVAAWRASGRAWQRAESPPADHHQPVPSP